MTPSLSTLRYLAEAAKETMDDNFYQDNEVLRQYYNACLPSVILALIEEVEELRKATR